MLAIRQILAKMSHREKVLALGGAIILGGILIQSLFQPVFDHLAKQNAELKKLRDTVAVLPNQLERYQTLYLRQQKIQAEFQQVSFKDGVLSHLEELIKSKAQVDNPENYKISPLPERDFSDQYTQEPFRVELQITSESNLKEFLTELVKGAKPLVLTGIQVKKSPNQSRLIVLLDISNFQKI